VTPDGCLESTVVEYFKSGIACEPSQRETVRLGTSVLPILTWFDGLWCPTVVLKAQPSDTLRPVSVAYRFVVASDDCLESASVGYLECLSKDNADQRRTSTAASAHERSARKIARKYAHFRYDFNNSPNSPTLRHLS